MSEQSRYPLSWPAGWVRTPARDRMKADFRKVITSTVGGYNGQPATIRKGERALTVAEALQRLDGELGRLGADDPVLSTNIRVRLDGAPRSGEPEPVDPGAAVYFMLRKRPTVLACDRWLRTADNIAAIAQHIDALRRIDRYGVGSLAQAFAGYVALPAAATDWWVILGLEASAPLDEVEARYRALAREHHPDQDTGDSDYMARLNVARDEARKALA